MTRLFNDPASFTEDATAGFLDAFASFVVGVPGGVVRRHATREGKVAVVVGGGSGHYPAFAGIVGPGYADGAVIGNVFTSPSAAEAASVSRAAHNGAGVLLATGNYAGDVMNFGLAVERLAEEGIEARYVAVTDDVASAGKDQREKRRGISGDVTVFKCASAAAEEGMDLNGVERVARLANDHTRSLGVAFSGCTMPGAQDPLFTVSKGKMGVGLGIHGEPGISEDDMTTAAELATRLVHGVLEDAPETGSTRLAVILNGLGSTKYEELFIMWGTVAKLLRAAGFGIVEPEVGELVTSLDMAGCSLTLMWLDEELERLWRAPASTPAYHKGRPTDFHHGEDRSADDAVQRAEPASRTTGSVTDAAKAAGRTAAAALTAIAAMMAELEDELGRIDAVAGDGDHGRGMVRGSVAARNAARAASDGGRGVGTVLRAAGDEWAARAGGTSGVLWGELLNALGKRLGDDAAPDAVGVAEGVQQGFEALMRLGGAKPGDKTMLDALQPFSNALFAAIEDGASLSEAWSAAADKADQAAKATADMLPKVGRARPLAERSKGTPDAGAVSMAVIIAVVGRVLAEPAND